MKWARVTYLVPWWLISVSKWSITNPSALCQTLYTSSTPNKSKSAWTSVLLTTTHIKCPHLLFQAPLLTPVVRVSKVCLLLTILTRLFLVSKCLRPKLNAYVCPVKWKLLLNVKSISCRFCSKRPTDEASLLKNKKRKFRKSFTVSKFSWEKKTSTSLGCCKRLLLLKTVVIPKLGVQTVR
jgi:hypothetical protein